jgi:hypothetical protein
MLWLIFLFPQLVKAFLHCVEEKGEGTPCPFIKMRAPYALYEGAHPSADAL